MKSVVKRARRKLSRAKAAVLSKALVRRWVGDYELLVMGDHLLPKIIETYPDYSTNLPRLAAHLLTSAPTLRLIDVGANVGDTVALCRTLASFPILCIEGNRKYFQILSKNSRQFKDVSIVCQFLGETNETRASRSREHKGTSQVTPGGEAISFRTLDALLVEYPAFESARILKIDTDGFDGKVLRGAAEFLKTVRPVLFFEFDRESLEEQGDNGMTLLKTLGGFGYVHAIFYDNLGRLLLSLGLKEEHRLEQLYLYIKNQRGAFSYYDIALFHSRDEGLFEEFLAEEMKYFDQ